MKRIPFVVVPLVLMFVVAAVWTSPAIGTKAQTPSVDVSAAVPVDLSPKPIPRVMESSGCFWNCGIQAIQPGQGGKCWVRFTVFHSDYGTGCCDHFPPDELEFCFRPAGTSDWCLGSAYKGTHAYNESAGCWGYYYLSVWLQLDDDTSWDFYFRCATGCYCGDTVPVDC